MIRITIYSDELVKYNNDETSHYTAYIDTISYFYKSRWRSDLDISGIFLYYVYSTLLQL